MAGEFDIVSVYTREIRGADGISAAEVEVVLENGAHGRACAPLGSDRKEERGQEKRVGESPCKKLSSPKASEILREALLFEDSSDQRRIDHSLTEIACRCNTELLPSGLIPAASMSVTKAAAAGHKLPLYRYLGGIAPGRLPSPLVTMLHFNNKSEPEQAVETGKRESGEIMVIPLEWSDYSEGFHRCCKVRQTLKKLLTVCGQKMDGSDRGIFHIETQNREEASGYVTDAIRLSGNRPGKDMAVITSVTDCKLFGPERLQITPFIMEKYLTVTAAYDALEAEKSRGYTIAVSTGPRDTEEVFAADFAAAFRCDYLKTDAPDRLGQIAKCNEILRLEEWMKHFYPGFS